MTRTYPLRYLWTKKPAVQTTKYLSIAELKRNRLKFQNPLLAWPSQFNMRGKGNYTYLKVVYMTFITLCISLTREKKQLRCYPGPRGFSWFFFAKEIKSKQRSGDNESRKRRGETEKPLVTLTSNLTSMQTTGSGSDPRALIGWYFFKRANQFDWLV